MNAGTAAGRSIADAEYFRCTRLQASLTVGTCRGYRGEWSKTRRTQTGASVPASGKAVPLSCRDCELASKLEAGEVATWSMEEQVRRRGAGWKAEDYEHEEEGRLPADSPMAGIGETTTALRVPIVVRKRGRGGRPTGIWTAANDALVREEYPTADTEELAGRIGTTRGALKQRASALGVRRVQRVAAPKVAAGRPRGTVHRWTDADDERIRREYPTGDTGTIAAALGVSMQAVATRAHRLGVERDAEVRRAAESAAAKVREASKRGEAPRAAPVVADMAAAQPLADGRGSLMIQRRNGAGRNPVREQLVAARTCQLNALRELLLRQGDPQALALLHAVEANERALAELEEAR